MPRESRAGDPDDRTRLRHIIDAARSAIRFSTGKTREDLTSDEMLARAILHCCLEIGEAANALSDPTRLRLSKLPWRQIIAMRNILVHVYWGVDLDKVWQTVKEDLPALLAAVEPALDLEDSGEPQ